MIKTCRSHFLKPVFGACLLASTLAFSTPGEAQFFQRLADAAFSQTLSRVTYDPAYVKIAYPGGDVPANKGVCTDVLIRAYRQLGIDLQKEVHEDMVRSFASYPRDWGRETPDPNIDHRRVPNLMTFFRRHGTMLPRTTIPADYRPGDIVAWDLGRGINHIGLVSDHKSADGMRYQIVHNIGAGPRLEDRLFAFRIIGHYRYSK